MYNIDGIWFFGVVESRMDPLQLGRVQVRVYGLHTNNKAQIPSDGLHWASVGMPANSASMNGIGDTPKLVEGSTVLGIFLDGDSYQQPIVLFSIPGIPQDSARPSVGFYDPRTDLSSASVPGLPDSVSYPSVGLPSITEPAQRPSYPRETELDKPDVGRLARNDDPELTHSHISKSNSRRTGVGSASHTSAGGSDSSIPGFTWDEPVNPYDAEYPYNRVIESESGHIIEIDDTPGAERVNIFHRSGSFSETHADGSSVTKTVGDHYSLFHNNHKVLIQGDQDITIQKGHRLKVNAAGGTDSMIVEVSTGGNLSITVQQGNANLYVGQGDVNMKVANGNVNTDITGNVNQTIVGDVTEDITGNVNQTVSGSSTETVAGTKTITATGNVIISGAEVRIN